MEASYRADLDTAAPALGGQLTVRAIVSYLDKMLYAFPNAPSLDRSGEVGLSANPRWSGVVSADWRRGAWSVYAQERFIGSGAYDKTLIDGATIADNHVKAVTYTDLTIGHRLSERVGGGQVYLTVNNLFDKTPPIVPIGTLGTFFPTNAALYDVIGRYYSVGVNFKF
jgi:outer membrane receptor protein involved in Fe transport